MADPTTPGFYTTKAVAELFSNEELRTKFMGIYLQSPQDAGKFLAEQLSIPEDMVEQIISKSGAELSEFVGKNVCDYLW